MTWRALLDLVFPPQCAGCNAIGAGFCPACAAAARAIRVRMPSLSITAFGAYEGALRSAILALKDGRRDVAESLGRILAAFVAPAALLVPIPTTATRRRVRGFDGVALVARSAAEIAGASVLDVLEQSSGDAQRGRSRSERLAARGRFRCDGRVGGRCVTLVDDVCTTGSTLRDCADAVRRAGGVVEDAVVVAATKTAHPWRPPALN